MVKRVSDTQGYAFEGEPVQRGKRRRRASVEDETARAVELARRIDWAAEKAGLSIEMVAATAGVHGDYVRNIARGGARHPSFFTVMLISSQCQVSPYFLAQMTDDPQAFKPPAKAAK